MREGQNISGRILHDITNQPLKGYPWFIKEHMVGYYTHSEIN